MTLVGDARSFIVLARRSRDDAESLDCDLALDVPVERYEVTVASAGPR